MMSTRLITSRRAALRGLGAGAGLALFGSPNPTATAASSPRLVLPANAKVLGIGDSYLAGVGAVPTTNGFAYKIAAPLGWTVTNDGVGGSGYCNPTTYGAGTYNDHLLRHPANSFDLVLLQGGSNDDHVVDDKPVYSDTTLNEGIVKTLTTVRSRYPRAKILMMGMVSPYGPSWARVNNLLMSAAKAHAVPFINPFGEKWFLPGDGALFANTDNGHPNNAGHAHLRSLFVRDVQVLTTT